MNYIVSWRRRLVAARKPRHSRLTLPGAEAFQPSFKANIVLAFYWAISHSQLLESFHFNRLYETKFKRGYRGEVIANG